MGLVDTLKAKLAPAKEKVSDLGHRHGGRIGHGLDRAAKAADEKTKHKYSSKIETGAGKAKHALGRLSHKGEGRKDDGTAPPAA
ncbi:antitoxin [Streptomyces sp. HNM0663]|uniref:Antitoxin n=1 Tax=Streptomyces chengmaiensis TaxID=3040919 RepID=A0ABT6HUL9_9ACTN|nr:antitoxin [Streptomyces chengmaiensis]MDH2391968.1 antitoxin [Streptomyces chengmaiensis]